MIAGKMYSDEDKRKIDFIINSENGPSDKIQRLMLALKIEQQEAWAIYRHFRPLV